jgi:hypothetical protein
MTAAGAPPLAGDSKIVKALPPPPPQHCRELKNCQFKMHFSQKGLGRFVI